MSTKLEGLEDLYISSSLMDTAPDLQYYNLHQPQSVNIKIIIITTAIFVAMLTWYEVLRSYIDNIFADEPNYGATWLRLFYAVIVTFIAIILTLFFK